MLASILLTHHNLAFFLTHKRQASYRSDQFAKFRRDYTEQLDAGLESGADVSQSVQTEYVI